MNGTAGKRLEGLLQPVRVRERLKAIVFLFPRPPAASPAAPAATDGPTMIAGKLAAAGAARLGRTSRCHACRGGLRGPLGTRGMEARSRRRLCRIGTNSWAETSLESRNLGFRQSFVM